MRRTIIDSTELTPTVDGEGRNHPGHLPVMMQTLSAAQQAQPERRPYALVHARARFKPDGRGPGISKRERGDGGERLTGGACLSSLTLR